ncbi:MAG: 4-alpha-glucanotransferase [Labilithrix sp.]|nr:4-alpha-glucanotransferase [Labilithrix sp.]MCW5811863.1 4-alpha-glucanotransferase [Labilithrix sp.]
MHAIDGALAELGVRRFLLAIHDVSFPTDPDEDAGRGTPYSRASERFLDFARGLGFTGLQLGPQGQTSIDNASPYDGTFFSRNVDSLPLRAFAGLVDDADLAAAIVPPSPRADHARAHRALHHLVARARETGDVDGFLARHREWLEKDALYDALRAGYGDKGFRDWPAHGDAGFWLRDPSALLAQHAAHVRRYAFAQLLAHEAHSRFRDACARRGLVLYADLQVGTSDADAWARASCFLRDYVMGAPPSRTNPEGQPWGYGVLDPRAEGAAFFDARIEKTFAEYDGLRVDHPHGLVCPWVYRHGTADPEAAVRAGARLHESPDLPDHPALAPFAIARADQLDRAVPRYADEWVTGLDQSQIDRYAARFDRLVAAAVRNGRDPKGLACEVLSTAPHPLRCVLERHRLGRFRITQKANLDDPSDGYRTENAAPPDWAMIGNHDTPPVFALVRDWPIERREKWRAYLGPRLRLSAADETRLALEPRFLAQALLADLFLCPAENVSIFFGDLFGYEESFNVPGLVHPDNWTLRLPADFESLYARRLSTQSALDIPFALALALDARGSTSGLAAHLRQNRSSLE